MLNFLLGLAENLLKFLPFILVLWILFGGGWDKIAKLLGGLPKLAGSGIGIGLVALLAFIGFMAVFSDESRAQLDKLTEPWSVRASQETGIYVLSTNPGFDPTVPGGSYEAKDGNTVILNNPIVVARAREELLKQTVQNQKLTTELSRAALEAKCAGGTTIDASGNVTIAASDAAACEQMKILPVEQAELNVAVAEVYTVKIGETLKNLGQPVSEISGAPAEYRDPDKVGQGIAFLNMLPLWVALASVILAGLGIRAMIKAD